ncbi:type II secretion system protein [Alkalibacillus haloalkaliphilus]|uniref:type II secretion system protein n=1 Tax=Alkalibacillus haloalkaliphilus TaxID=94136 RepID=UPI0002DCD3AF|nr:prepilin-type N-terminal cleavage/methylation domain-containing protein [Alkalibacillus haloalkaliphilus]
MLKRLMKNQKGITLVELLAVIVILGIIALIAVPAIANVIEDSRYDSVKATAINIIEAADLYDVTNEVDGDELEISVLIEGDYLDGGNLDGNWTGVEVKFNDERGTLIDGTGSDGNVSITFEDATIQNINNANASDLRQAEGGATIGE